MSVVFYLNLHKSDTLRNLAYTSSLSACPYTLSSSASIKINDKWASAYDQIGYTGKRFKCFFSIKLRKGMISLTQFQYENLLPGTYVYLSCSTAGMDFSKLIWIMYCKLKIMSLEPSNTPIGDRAGLYLCLAGNKQHARKFHIHRLKSPLIARYRSI
jgi:hypothetical protein